MTLDGTLTMLNSSKITDAGVSIDMIDTQGEEVDKEARMIKVYLDRTVVTLVCVVSDLKLE